MSVPKIRYRIEKKTRQYVMIRAVELAFVAVAIALFVGSIGSLLPLPASTGIIAGIAAGVIYFYSRARKMNVFGTSTSQLIRYVNRKYPELEQSGDLLLRDEAELTTLQRLQVSRSAKQFEIIYPNLRLPSEIGKTAVILLVSILFSFGIIYLFDVKGVADSLEPAVDPITNGAVENLPAEIKSVTTTVRPPAYTALAIQQLHSFTLNLPEGSEVRWSIVFTNQVTHPKIILYGRDTLSLKGSENEFTINKTLSTSGFYQLAWTNPDGSKKYSDYFQIGITRDQSPIVKVTNLDQFIELSMTDDLQVDMKSTIEDDYGLKDAYIIATVSKGSGESVKFREEKLKFDKPAKISGKTVAGSLRLDLKKLGLDPGDELYFYVEAKDTKEPQFNKARTETYFITLKDTAQMETSVDPGLGVDLLPEYFRSQRQIIIDSEKLLKDKSKITQQVFKSKSNELGYDEKVLRLRYGEFLGEEFETSIGPAAGPSSEDTNEQDVTKVYGHQHDTEKEHAAAEEIKPHAHDQDKDKEDPSKDYMHAHDSEEEATFFTQSIRSKLKAAVSIMWDAELHLRLFDPAKSLPYQYKALKLLKEISQDSRIYVHRTGFDPPPLKEEKRLTGDLSDLKNAVGNKTIYVVDNYPAIRGALTLIEKHPKGKSFLMTEDVKSTLLRAGNELSAAALQQPGRYLKSLSLLKSLVEGELKPEDIETTLQKIKGSFYAVLPAEVFSPQLRNKTSHPLDDQFLDNIGIKSNESPK